MERFSSYQPGGTTEFPVGQYDFAAGQRRFRVTFEFDRAQDRAKLTVVQEPGGQRLVDAVPVALNGWNPVGSAVMGVSFDARTGSVVVIDGVRIRPAASKDSAEGDRPDPLLSYDFEGANYPLDQDVAGREGWTLSSFSQAPATSVVSAVALNAELQAARLAVLQARRAFRASQLPRLAALVKLQAAQAGVTSWRRASRRNSQSTRSPRVAMWRPWRGRPVVWNGAQRFLQAEADLAAAELALATAEAKPEGMRTRPRRSRGRRRP